MADIIITTHFKVSEQSRLVEWSRCRLGTNGWTTSFKYDITLEPKDWDATLIIVDKTLMNNKYIQWELLRDNFSIIS